MPPQEWHRSSYLKQRFPEQRTAASMQVGTDRFTGEGVARVSLINRESGTGWSLERVLYRFQALRGARSSRGSRERRVAPVSWEMVDGRGIEPLTSALRTQRSPS